MTDTINLPKFPKCMVLTGRVAAPLLQIAQHNGYDSLDCFYKESGIYNLPDKFNLFPVSCTVITLADTLTFDSTTHVNGQPSSPWESIIGSLDYTGQALSGGAGVAIDLSNLRGSGNDNGKGVVASGVTSFLPVLSSLNGYVKKGGSYKGGAITCYLNFSHPDIKSFLDCPKSSIPWVKRAVYVDRLPGETDYPLNPEDAELLELLLQKYNNGDIFVVKKTYEEDGTRVYSNVCLEILIKSRASCMLAPVNLGLIDDLTEIPEQMYETLVCLNAIRSQAPRLGIYLSADEDMQVGVGFIGLANLLGRFGVTYSQLAEVFTQSIGGYIQGMSDAYQVYLQLSIGFSVCDDYSVITGLRRWSAIAPTISSAVREKDIDGMSVSMNIAPPLCHPKTKKLERVSEAHGSLLLEYPWYVESAGEVDFEDYYKVVQGFQYLMDRNGKGHSISFDTWDTMTVDKDWFTKWLEDNNIAGLYYRQAVKGMGNIGKSKIDVAPEIASEPVVQDILEFTGTTCKLKVGDHCSSCD